MASQIFSAGSSKFRQQFLRIVVKLRVYTFPMPWPPEIEVVAKILARHFHRKLGMGLDPARHYGGEDAYADASWFVYKVDATRIMGAMREAGWKPPERKE